MFPNRNNPAHSSQKLKQLYDFANEEFNQLNTQINSLRHELDKARSEIDGHLRSQAGFSENFYSLNCELMRNAEIAKRLTAAVNQFVPMLPPEHQATAIQVVERAKNVTTNDILMQQQQQHFGMMPGMFNGLGGPAPFPPQMMAAAFSGMKPEDLAMAMATGKHPGMMMPPNMNAMMALAGQMPSVSAAAAASVAGHPGMIVEDVANRLSNRSGSGTPMKKPKLDPDVDQNLEIDVQGDDAPATGSGTNGVKREGRESAQSHTSSRDSATPKSRNANPLTAANLPPADNMTNFLAQFVSNTNKGALDPRILFNSPSNGKPAYSYHCRNDEQPRPFDFPENALTESGLPKGLKKVFELPQGEVVCAVTFAPTNESVYTGGKGCVKLWDIRNAETASTPISSFNVLPEQYIRSCKLFPEDSWILVGGEASKIVVYDVSRESCVAEFDTGSQACYALAVAPDSNMCFSCCADGKVVLWDVRMKQKIKALVGHTEGASCIDLSPDGTTFWTGGLDSTVRCWDIREQREIEKHSFENQVFSLGCSPTSPWVAVGCENTQVEVFNTQASEKYILHSHESCVLSLKFSKTGKYFVTTGKDNFVNVSRTPYGARLVRLTENASVLSCDISSDDKYLVTGSGEKKANVYQIEFND